MYQQPKRIEFLDSIRGIAALSVLLYHSTMFEWPAGITNFIWIPVINVLFDGKAAVAMFIPHADINLHTTPHGILVEFNGDNANHHFITAVSGNEHLPHHRTRGLDPSLC